VENIADFSFKKTKKRILLFWLRKENFQTNGKEIFLYLRSLAFLLVAFRDFTENQVFTKRPK
jgi:hypothetical protein